MNETVLIDAGPLGGGITGAGQYAFHMIDELLRLDSDLQFRIIMPSPDSHDWDTNRWTELDHVKPIFADITGIGIHRNAFYIKKSINFDVFHSLSSYLPLFLRGNSPRLVTIHDLKHLQIPHLFDEYDRFKSAYIRYRIRRSIRTADQVITVSKHTKDDIVDEFGRDPATISPVLLGSGGERGSVTGPPPVDPPYFLFVGAIRRHKNLDVLIEAYNSFRRRTAHDIDLVIAGSIYNSYLSELQQSIDENVQDDVHFTGYVDDETVASLYEHATVFVYPSIYEGFGLPPLEAMGYGAPVVVSNATSIPEVVDDAGLYFDPTNPCELVDQLERVLSDQSLRSELIAKGHERFVEFSWKRTACETLDIYRRVIE